MRRWAIAIALAAPALAAAQGPRLALALEGGLARVPQDPRLAGGAALSGRLGPVEAALAFDRALLAPRGETGFARDWSAGAGVAIDASPLLSVHAHAVAGVWAVQLRDYVFGGWRTVSEASWGGRAAVRFHSARRIPRSGRLGVWPVAGLWVAVLRVGSGADRLRDARWGGTLAVVGASLGAELTGPGPRWPSP